jgi:hypothetical protein
VSFWYVGFAWQGWMTGYSWFGRGNLVQGSWFLTSSTYNTVNQSYLFGYADGGGGFQSIADVGTSTDFGTTPSKVVFNALFGSYFGDWDRSNCVLRAPLAATGSSHGLVSFWPGSVGTANSYDPLTNTTVKNMTSWMLHPMAMGETIGYCARIAQAYTPYNQWTPHGTSGSIYAALMGDPSLRAFVPKPVASLTATDNSGSVNLNWSAPAEPALLGYHVYRAPDAAGPYSRLNAALLTTPNHTDTAIPSSGSWHYMVRTVIRETTGSGSYENTAQGTFAATAVTATSPYGIWADSHALTGNDSLPTAEPLADGIPNLLKYALGIDPQIAGFQGHLDHGTTPVTDATHLTLSYTRPAPTPIGVIYTVETSGDLATWSSDGTVEVASTDNGNGTRTITVRDGSSNPPAAKRFIRLKISAAP